MQCAKWSVILFMLIVLGCGTANNPELDMSDTAMLNMQCTTPEDADFSANETLTVEDQTYVSEKGFVYQLRTYNGHIPGPVYQMQVGETKTIKLINHSAKPVSLHFHGLAFDPSDDGTFDTPPSIVYPDCAHVYTITAKTPGVWPYHSHLNTSDELIEGLYGAIIVPDETEVKVDHEYVLFLGQLSAEEEHEEGEEEEEEEGMVQAPVRMTFNGDVFGMGAMIEWMQTEYIATTAMMPITKVGDHVRWRLLNVSPDEWHTFGVHSHVFCDRGGLSDGSGDCPKSGLMANILNLSPLTGASIEYMETKPGSWMYHCHILDHVAEGMMAYYQTVK